MLKLEIPITRTTWYRWKKCNGVVAEPGESSNNYRTSCSRLQSENRKNLEREAVELFKKKSRGGSFGQRFMGLAFREIMKKEPFCNDPELIQLKFSNKFLDRIVENYGFKQATRKSDQEFIPPAVLDSYRQGIILKMGPIDAFVHANTDETAVLYNSVSPKDLRCADETYKIKKISELILEKVPLNGVPLNGV